MRDENLNLNRFHAFRLQTSRDVTRNSPSMILLRKIIALFYYWFVERVLNHPSCRTRVHFLRVEKTVFSKDGWGTDWRMFKAQVGRVGPSSSGPDTNDRDERLRDIAENRLGENSLGAFNVHRNPRQSGSVRRKLTPNHKRFSWHEPP
jgi:hypothetical protein